LAAEENLMDTWESHILELRGSRKNGHIYKEMSDVLRNKNHMFSPQEVQEKIHNLTNKYKAEKKKIGPTGGTPSEWPHFRKIQSFLGSFKCHNNESLMEESTSKPKEQ